MLHYESAKCLHGRMQVLKGKYYGSIFIHYAPVNHEFWKYTHDDVIAAVPPHWKNNIKEDQGRLTPTPYCIPIHPVDIPVYCFFCTYISTPPILTLIFDVLLCLLFHVTHYHHPLFTIYLIYFISHISSTHIWLPPVLRLSMGRCCFDY